MQRFSKFVRHVSVNHLKPQSAVKFSEHARGSGAGPFVEFPTFHTMDNSIMVQMPKNTTLYTRLNRVACVSKMNLTQEEHQGPYTKIVSYDDSSNILLTGRDSVSNFVVVNVDDYEQGWNIKTNDIVCYSGDLKVSDTGIVKGRGTVAVNGVGEIYSVALGAGESMFLNPAALVGYTGEHALPKVEIQGGAISPNTTVLQVQGPASLLLQSTLLN